VCQLTFSDLGSLDKSLNRIFITNQLILNSYGNPDGVGIFNGKEIWRTELAAHKTTNLGECLKLNIHKEPIMGHVRLASNKTLNTKECSHPFGGSRLVLMHNGRLEPEDNTLIDLTKVDSQVFLTNFEKWWLESNNDLTFPKALSEYMKQWEGKFAFLIFDLKDSTYYVVRGSTASLYWTTVNEKLIINTEQKELIGGLNILSQLNQVLHNQSLEIGEVKEIDKNSIFKFNRESSTLEKVEDIVENAITYTQSSTYGYWQTANGVQTWVPYNRYVKSEHKKHAYSTLTNYVRDLGLSIMDINTISEITLGAGLVELDADRWDLLKKEVLEVLKKDLNQNKLNVWARISSAGLEYDAYKKHLNFPWMLNTEEDIKTAITNLASEGNKIK